MSKNLKFRNLIVDAIANIPRGKDDVLRNRAWHRSKLLQDVSNDIQIIINESNVSIEDAIDEWLAFNELDSKNKIRRREFAKLAIQKFPVVINS